MTKEEPSQMTNTQEPRILNFPDGLHLEPGQAIRVLEGGGYEIVGVTPAEEPVNPPVTMAAETSPSEAIPARRRAENQ